MNIKITAMKYTKINKHLASASAYLSELYNYIILQMLSSTINPLSEWCKKYQMYRFL